MSSTQYIFTVILLLILIIFLIVYIVNRFKCKHIWKFVSDTNHAGGNLNEGFYNYNKRIHECTECKKLKVEIY